MDKTLICSYARTPIGSFQGQFKTIHASKLGANTISATIERSIINGDKKGGISFMKMNIIRNNLKSLGLK